MRRTLAEIFLCFATLISAHSQVPKTTRFEIAFPASDKRSPITGRVFVMITRDSEREPRFQIGDWMSETPFFGMDVSNLRPGESTIVDASTRGYPTRSLIEIPAGDYYVQALFNVYTEFHRADGHVIWAHMDQWEGQQFNRSPGNLYTTVERVHLDPAVCYVVKLSLTRVIPSVTIAADTKYVKRIKIRSKLLSDWWGQPVYVGATILLPAGYDEHPNESYPVIYEQGHFGQQPALGFMEPTEPDANLKQQLSSMTGAEFYRAWTGANYPRVIAVTFQHPTPFYDDSYAVNSANQGPYGDTIMQELIPYLEEHFRIIRQPWARVLTGGSTGGWESLALQIYHPDFFGGTWSFFPDPVDFRRYQLVNIYEDSNAFTAPGFEYLPQERPMMRTAEGQVLATTRQVTLLEEVLGTHGRSGQQFAAWEAAYGPVGADGYPRPLWDKLTGRIDREVALYMRDHGFDLTYYLRQNWTRIGPKLVGKIHVFCGDMDNYYLNNAVYLLDDFLKGTQNPNYAGSFEYGRPMKGHGWHPMNGAELVRIVAETMKQNSGGKGQ